MVCVGREGCGFKGGEGQFAVILGHHRVASVRDEGELSRVLVSCRMWSWVVIGGGLVSRLGAILGCSLVVAIAVKEGLLIVAIEGWKLVEWGWFSRAVRV